ncbi:hypothetical protein JXL19_05090, partial [bacterium]|nr:hypothetical protein [bacterium]
MLIKQDKIDLKIHHEKRLAVLLSKAPFILRITEWKGYPAPVLVAKERQEGLNGAIPASGSMHEMGKKPETGIRKSGTGHGETPVNLRFTKGCENTLICHSGEGRNPGFT